HGRRRAADGGACGGAHACRMRDRGCCRRESGTRAALRGTAFVACCVHPRVEPGPATHSRSTDCQAAALTGVALGLDHFEREMVRNVEWVEAFVPPAAYDRQHWARGVGPTCAFDL